MVGWKWLVLVFVFHWCVLVSLWLVSLWHEIFHCMTGCISKGWTMVGGEWLVFLLYFIVYLFDLYLVAWDISSMYDWLHLKGFDYGWMVWSDGSWFQSDLPLNSVATQPILFGSNWTFQCNDEILTFIDAFRNSQANMPSNHNMLSKRNLAPKSVSI